MQARIKKRGVNRLTSDHTSIISGSSLHQHITHRNSQDCVETLGGGWVSGLGLGQSFRHRIRRRPPARRLLLLRILRLALFGDSQIAHNI